MNYKATTQYNLYATVNNRGTNAWTTYPRPTPNVAALRLFGQTRPQHSAKHFSGYSGHFARIIIHCWLQPWKAIAKQWKVIVKEVSARASAPHLHRTLPLHLWIWHCPRLLHRNDRVSSRTHYQKQPLIKVEKMTTHYGKEAIINTLTVTINNPLFNCFCFSSSPDFLQPIMIQISSVNQRCA